MIPHVPLGFCRAYVRMRAFLFSCPSHRSTDMLWTEMHSDVLNRYCTLPIPSVVKFESHGHCMIREEQEGSLELDRAPPHEDVDQPGYSSSPTCAHPTPRRASCSAGVLSCGVLGFMVWFRVQRVSINLNIG